MNILMYMWKAYNQADIKRAFIGRGHTVQTLEYHLENYEEDEVFERLLTHSLTEKEIAYDVVFSVNYFPVISDVCEKIGVKYAAWTCDSPISALYHESAFNSCNYIFAFDKMDYMAFKDMGMRVFYLPLAASIERVGQAEKRFLGEESAYDVSFVGSMYGRNSYDELADKLPDYIRGYFDGIMKMQMEIYGENYMESMLTADILEELGKYFKLKKSERSFSDIRHVFVNSVLGFKLARMERLSMINHISKYFKVDVFTDEDMEFVMAVNHGKVDYLRELPQVFRQSKINLNFSIRNIRSGIPLRVWDILAAGGFCITNFQLEMPVYFKNGRDLVWFEDKRDLTEKIRYYLEHEEERKEIAYNGYMKIKELHNNDIRVKQMLEILKM